MHPPAWSGVDGGLARVLADPWVLVQALLSRAGAWAQTWGPATATAGIAAGGVLIGLRWWWRTRCRRALHERARLVTILAPPEVDADSAEAMWANLVGLVRPVMQRLTGGQPHVAWEFVFGQHGVQIRLWVPGTVPPGMVEHAVEAAWPGAHTRTTEASPPVPAPAAGQRRLVTGGTLRLARSEALPLRTTFDTDPLRGLLGAPVGLSRDETACVQLLARPVTGRRVQSARRAARRLDAGHAARLPSRLLDLITPGAHSRTTRSTSTTRDPQTSLALQAQNRAIVGKQRGGQWETRLRYAVAATVPADTPPAQLARIRDQLRGRAHALASAYAAFTEHNHLRRRRLRRPAEALQQRRLHRGDLLSVPELAALAHVPTDQNVPGLARAGARALPPPPATPATGELVRPIGVSDAANPARSGCRSPTPATTCTCSARPGRASPRSWPG